ncbi:MAG: metallophosphoesterase [Selenomonas sp.]|nr:metallophosphoesterase [Selenomonas sp.]
METNDMIINGPYLLSPAPQAMTVAWEMAQEQDMEILYGREGKEKSVQAVSEREPGEKGYFIYTARLEGLVPETDYSYKVQSAAGKVCRQAGFRTLAEKPDKLHLVTVSDTHLLHADRLFASMVQHQQPDFILHGGDISFGTGYQHEQYGANWFQRIPEVLERVPVFYVTGNHDDGPYFLKYFTDPQARHLNTSPDGHSFSMDYGCAHIVMADSNPWGLFEMNAENSGRKLDGDMRQRLEETLAWLEEDLMSRNAQQAKWRVLVLHHPYTDEYNNRHIVSLAERCRVDLVLGGHLHYYIKAVSIDPEVGARTVYVTQGSLQDPEAGCDKGTADARLLSDFPEVTAMGKNNYGILDIDGEALDYKLYGFSAEGPDKLVDAVHLVHEEPQVSFSDIKLRRLDNKGLVEIQAQAENTGRVMAEAVLELKDNGRIKLLNLFGERAVSRIILLEPGENCRVTAFYQAKSPGEHKIEVGGESLKLLVFEPTELAFAHMDLSLGEGKHADCLFASIEAVNNLDHEIFTSVPLYINQRMVESQSSFFRAHEKRRLSFCHQFAQGGEYQVSIADQLPRQIQVEGGIRIIPRVMDKSGHGHTVLLHGSPKVMQREGRMEVCLESYGDYLEIPPSPDLIFPQGFTGMVWARLNRLAQPQEMGHSPLLVRGKSVGWGANYLMRMVVDRAGGLKWGTCHDITEYQWQGGMAKVGKWAQYTMAFDKQRGGDSYCDGEKVAHIVGVPEEAELRQWEDQPIFVGYSYIGHVLPEINRPKYFTHLPANISQVRLYRQGLTEAENSKIQGQPESAGPKAQELALWLDFRHILTVGSHTTEWRHPVVYDPAFKTEKKYWQFRQLRYRATLPLQAGMKAVVEVSDDKASVKGRLELTLKSGTNYVDLAPLPPAQYLRIVTDFSAQVGEYGTFVPELHEYQVIASDGNDFTDMFWSTRPDWERGTFAGAVGFAPVDRLRDYPEYTDIIHG